MAVFSLLERLDFSGKKVIPLMTHEGSGTGQSERDIRGICKGAKFGKGLAVHGAESANSKEKVSVWAKNSV